MNLWKMFIVMLCALVFSACGDVASDTNGALSFTISKPKNFSAQAEHGKVERYIVTVSGEGIAQPIVKEFVGESYDARIDGIPCGNDRKISVEAINPNGAKVFAADREGVSISGGVNEVEVELESVPVFTNLHDGSLVENTRLVIGVFADPRDLLTISARSNDVDFSLSGKENSAGISTSESTWLAGLAVGNLPAGEYEILSRNLSNGRESAVNVRLVEGGELIPAPIFNSAATSQGGVATAGFAVRRVGVKN